MNQNQALGSVFAAEIENRLPFQSKAAIYKRLRDQGLIQDMDQVFGIVRVRGYQLTHAGRLSYCMSCPDPESTPAGQQGGDT